MDVFFLGTGEAFSEKPNTSLLIDDAVLLECGPTSLMQLRKSGKDLQEIQVVYVSHLHADHFFGLPCFLAACREDGRKKPIDLIFPGDDALLDMLLDVAYGLCLQDLGFMVHTLNPEGRLCIGGYCFSFAPMHHSRTVYGVRVEKGDKNIFYGGDGIFSPAALNIARGVDLMVCEAYLEGVKGHCSILGACRSAKAVGCKRLALVHVSRKEDTCQKILEGRALFERAFLPGDLELVKL